MKERVIASAILGTIVFAYAVECALKGEHGLALAGAAAALSYVFWRTSKLAALLCVPALMVVSQGVYMFARQISA
jgi:hypothetical protein